MNKVKEYIQAQPEKTVGINDIAADLDMRKRQVIEALRDYLQETIKAHPDGLTITDLTHLMKINRNWIAKQLDLLFLSGKVERKRIGPAKVYSISEDGLNKWEKYYLALLENSSDLIIVAAFNNQQKLIINFVSQSIERILGYKPKNVEEIDFLDLIHPEDQDRLLNKDELFNEEESEQTIYLRVKNKQNDWRNLEVVATDLVDDPSVSGYVLNCKDITEIIKLEEQIQFRVIFEKFLLNLATKFIDFPFEKLDQIIANALSMIGKFFLQNTLQDYTVSPNQISMYLSSTDQQKLLLSHQWVASLASIGKSTILSAQTWDRSDFDFWFNKIADKTIVYYPNLNENIQNAESNAIKIFSPKIRAVILIPLFDEKENIAGFISFEFFNQKEQWTDPAVEMLNTIGQIIQSALRSFHRFIDQNLFEYFQNHRKSQ